MRNSLPPPPNNMTGSYYFQNITTSNLRVEKSRKKQSEISCYKLPPRYKTVSFKKSTQTFHSIIAGDKKTIALFDSIKSIAEYDFPVHISGDTGTGKELVARAIHNQSPRRERPFVPVNCGALPEGLIESELFGHVKGAFSGAVSNKRGRFELADGGTLFLDEVGELSKSAQVKLLRVLQEGFIEKVGSINQCRVNIRIISATNKYLKEEMHKGTFRDDLYYRLNVFPINLPPLCERQGDILPLAAHFLKTICRQYNKKAPVLSDSVRNLFITHPWPGNVRELQNVICYAIIKSRDGIVTPECLPLEFPVIIEKPVSYSTSGKLTFDSVKDALILSGWNKTRAAKKLNIGRATLYRFLEKNNQLYNYKTV